MTKRIAWIVAIAALTVPAAADAKFKGLSDGKIYESASACLGANSACAVVSRLVKLGADQPAPAPATTARAAAPVADVTYYRDPPAPTGRQLAGTGPTSTDIYVACLREGGIITKPPCNVKNGEVQVMFLN